MAHTTPLKTVTQEGPMDRKSDETTRKSTLVQGELAHLEAIRNEGTSRKAFHRANLCWEDFQYSLKIVRQNPRILVFSFIVFAILCGGGLGLVFFLAKDQDEDDKSDALDLATETGRWFCKWLCCGPFMSSWRVNMTTHAARFTFPYFDLTLCMTNPLCCTLT